MTYANESPGCAFSAYREAYELIGNVSEVYASAAPDVHQFEPLAGEDAEAAVLHLVQPAESGGRTIGHLRLARTGEADWRISSPRGRRITSPWLSPGPHRRRSIARRGTRSGIQSWNDAMGAESVASSDGHQFEVGANRAGFPAPTIPRLFSATTRSPQNHMTYAYGEPSRNLFSLQAVDKREQRIGPNASAISAKSNGGFHDSMDAWRRDCDIDLRLFFGSAS
jgi:hypothetical protein